MRPPKSTQKSQVLDPSWTLGRRPRRKLTNSFFGREGACKLSAILFFSRETNALNAGEIHLSLCQTAYVVMIMSGPTQGSAFVRNISGYHDFRQQTQARAHGNALPEPAGPRVRLFVYTAGAQQRRTAMISPKIPEHREASAQFRSKCRERADTCCQHEISAVTSKRAFSRNTLCQLESWKW